MTEEVIQLLPTSGLCSCDSASDVHTVPRGKQRHREVYNVGSCSAHSERIHSNVNLLLYYHLDHSVRGAVFQHRASGAVHRVTEERPVSLLTQKHESSHSSFCLVLCPLCTAPCFCRQCCIKLQNYRNSPHISYYSSCSL